MELSTWNYLSFLIQNVDLKLKLTGLRMRGVSHKLLFFSFLLIFVNPCVLERVERENPDLHEGDSVGTAKEAPVGNQQTLIIDDKNGPTSSTPEKDGQSIRSETAVVSIIYLWDNLGWYR